MFALHPLKQLTKATRSSSVSCLLPRAPLPAAPAGHELQRSPSRRRAEDVLLARDLGMGCFDVQFYLDSNQDLQVAGLLPQACVCSKSESGGTCLLALIGYQRAQQHCLPMQLLSSYPGCAPQTATESSLLCLLCRRQGSTRCRLGGTLCRWGSLRRASTATAATPSSTMLPGTRSSRRAAAEAQTA